MTNNRNKGKKKDKETEKLVSRRVLRIKWLDKIGNKKDLRRMKNLLRRKIEPELDINV